MNHNLGALKHAIDVIKNEYGLSASLKSIYNKLIESYKGLRDSGKSITNSAQLIDFFVHDILDYAVLRGKKQNFTKNIKYFNVEEAINQVLEILNDKAVMKNIQIQSKFEGFYSHYTPRYGRNVLLIKTDKKRM